MNALSALARPPKYNRLVGFSSASTRRRRFLDSLAANRFLESRRFRAKYRETTLPAVTIAQLVQQVQMAAMPQVSEQIKFMQTLRQLDR